MYFCKCAGTLMEVAPRDTSSNNQQSVTPSKGISIKTNIKCFKKSNTIADLHDEDRQAAHTVKETVKLNITF